MGPSHFGELRSDARLSDLLRVRHQTTNAKVTDPFCSEDSANLRQSPVVFVSLLLVREASAIQGVFAVSATIGGQDLEIDLLIQVFAEEDPSAVAEDRIHTAGVL